MTSTSVIAARRGTSLRCRNWRAEALLRMLENVLEVGENPGELIVYASLGKAARSWPDYHRIVAALTALEEDETLILQTGRPVGVMRTGPEAPMVVSAVNNTVGAWANPGRFYQRHDEGKTIWGGLTAAAWQYIGRQGVLQGTYELLRAAARRRLGGSGRSTLASRWLLTSGLGGMGSAQPISASMLGLSSLTVEANPKKAEAASAIGSISLVTADLSEALAAIAAATSAGPPVAVCVLGNAATVFDEIAARAERGALGAPIPALVTDQTAAHDPRYGYLPEEFGVESWAAAREADPERVESLARAAMGKQLTAMLRLADLGSVAFENGNNLRVQAQEHLDGRHLGRAFEIPGFMDGYLRPLFCRGIGPFRWVALSGDLADLAALDDLAASMFPQRPEVAEWIALAREQIPVQGLPARSCWLGHGERSAFAAEANRLVADGTLRAPVLFSRDHLDSAGMTHPLIGTENMADDSDGVSDWPILDAMLLSMSGADLVAVHSGGGGYSGWMQSAGVSVVADGSPAAERRLRAALDADTGLGVMRHASAGYPEAAEEIRAHTDGPAPIRWFPPQER